MFTLLDRSAERNCQGFNRREFLKVGIGPLQFIMPHGKKFPSGHDLRDVQLRADDAIWQAGRPDKGFGAHGDPTHRPIGPADAELRGELAAVLQVMGRYRSDPISVIRMYHG